MGPAAQAVEETQCGNRDGKGRLTLPNAPFPTDRSK